jgi:hypothetical protein
MTHLQHVWLFETAVTEVGVMNIAELPELTNLEVSTQQITADGLDDLHRRSPKLQITVTTDENDGSGFSRRRRR